MIPLPLCCCPRAEDGSLYSWGWSAGGRLGHSFAASGALLLLLIADILLPLLVLLLAPPAALRMPSVYRTVMTAFACPCCHSGGRGGPAAAGAPLLGAAPGGAAGGRSHPAGGLPSLPVAVVLSVRQQSSSSHCMQRVPIRVSYSAVMGCLLHAGSQPAVYLFSHPPIQPPPAPPHCRWPAALTTP